MGYFSNLRKQWRYCVAFIVLWGLALLVLLVAHTYSIEGWPIFLYLGLIMSASIILYVGTGIAIARGRPQFKSAIMEHSAFKIIGVLTMPFGYIMAKIFTAPIVQAELAQSFLTASSVLMGLSGVLLTIGRFSARKYTPQDILSGLFKGTLIFSLLAGFATMFLVLFWYAKATPGLLQWAGFSLFAQLSYVLLFLCFPKYYTK